MSRLVSHGCELRPNTSLKRTRLRSSLNSISSDDRRVSVISDTILGVRLGYFPRFKGADSVLLHGTSLQINALVPRLYEFLAFSRDEWAVHEHALVSRRCPTRLFASRMGMSNRTGYRWRCSPAQLPSIQSILQALSVSGSGHRRFELAGSTAQLIISAGEYPDAWWHANA